MKQKDHTKEMNKLLSNKLSLQHQMFWRVKLGTSIWEHQFNISCSSYIIFVATCAFLNDLSTWGNNSIQETIRKKNVSLTMKVGKSEVKGVLHEVLYVSGAPLS